MSDYRHYKKGDRVEFANAGNGPVRGVIRQDGDNRGWYKVLFDQPIFNGFVIETVHGAALRPLSLLELIAEAAI